MGGHSGGNYAPDRNERYKGQVGSGIMMAGLFDDENRVRDNSEHWMGMGSNKKEQGKNKMFVQE